MIIFREEVKELFQSLLLSWSRLEHRDVLRTLPPVFQSADGMLP